MPASERHAWIGFYPQASDGGVAISGIVPGGPAESAGLERGDLLVSVDGQPVRSLRQLYSSLWTKAPGDTVGMQVLRERVDPRLRDRRGRPLRVLQVAGSRGLRDLTPAFGYGGDRLL